MHICDVKRKQKKCGVAGVCAGAALFLALGSFALFLRGVDATPAFSDSAMYIDLGRTLSEGRGYVSAWLLGDPPHIKFPPFFPLLIAALVSCAGTNIMNLKIAVAVFGALGLTGMYCLLAKRHAGLAGLAVLASAVSPHLREYASSVLSEMPYMFVAALLLLAVQAAEEKADEYPAAACVAQAVLLVVVVMARLFGIALFVAMGIHLGTRVRMRREGLWRALGTLLPAAIALLGWGLHTVFHHCAGEGYLAYLNTLIEHRNRTLPIAAQIAETLLRNAYAIVMYAVPEILTGWKLTGPHAGAAVITGLTAYGVVRSARPRQALWELYVAVAIVLVICWPDTHISGVRFLAPLTALLLYYFGIGIAHVAIPLVKPGCQHRVALASLFLLVLSQALSGILSFPGAEQREMVRLTPSFAASMQWLREHTPQDAVLLPNPALASAIYLYSGRKSVLIGHADFPRRQPDPAQVYAFIAARHIDYGVIIKGLFQTPVSRALDQALAAAFPVCLNNDYATVYDMRGGRGIGSRWTRDE